MFAVATDGDGTTEGFGGALWLRVNETGDLYPVLAPTALIAIRNFAIAPDGGSLVICLGHDGLTDLMLLDFSGTEPTTRELTDDGTSCDPAW